MIRLKSGMICLLGLSLGLAVYTTGFSSPRLSDKGTTVGLRDDKQKRTKKLRLDFAQAGRTDTDPEQLDVLRSNNVVRSPDGTEAMPREGHSVYKRYNYTATDPVGRKIIVIDRKPPGVNLTANMIISTKRDVIDNLLYTREPTIASGDGVEEPVAGTAMVSMTGVEITSGDPVGFESADPIIGILCDIHRTGNLLLTTQAQLYCISSTAGGIVPQIYDADFGEFMELSFNAGENIPDEAGMDGTVATQIKITGWTATPPGQYTITLAIRAADANTEIDPDFGMFIINFTVSEA